MKEPEFSKNFWLGNGILAIAMIVLLFMGRLWQAMGPTAMILWTALVITGVFLLMKDKSGPSGP